MQTLRRMTSETESALESRLHDLRVLRFTVADTSNLAPHVEPLPALNTPAGECFSDAEGNVIYIPGAVKVTRDGVTRYTTASEFTKTSRTPKRAAKVAKVANVETARVSHGHDFTA